MATKSMAPLPQHRILHHLRLEWESHHQRLVYKYNAVHSFLYEPDIKDLDHVAADMTLEQEFFILQPLFRALAIVICGESFNDQVLDIGQLSVLVIRTGVEEGLSAPISFGPIAHQISAFFHGSHGETAVETALDTAIDFVMDLEEREIAAEDDEKLGWSELEVELWNARVEKERMRAAGELKTA
ncbi:hypothetical protein B0T26DRAFT_748209 [Lasiosphaeria miniovina]|uniref:Uncharacterized protein n=1 Tax=Lasiosphaeria miniovina TaxID=1954250 RepID=A0AA40B588_9PEZI|nr:uncharacterized protein B0T26DRAFT_748209 [Lasiosphaeria miniovina]KAK0727920.1 hypothetical protein B0T26DRAFT_748209 [Lasiosphaeria miniovina]